MKLEKPPPEPNWSVAISSPDAVGSSTKRVAPTAVTHGETAGQEGKIGGTLSYMEPPLIAPSSSEWPSTLVRRVQVPGFLALLVPEVAAAADALVILDVTSPKIRQHLLPSGHLDRPPG